MPTDNSSNSGFDRRAMLAASGLVAAGLVGGGAVAGWLRGRAGVFIARGQSYGGDLRTTIREGLSTSGIDAAALRGRRVLLKPNLVEPARDRPHMTTHPAVIIAAAEVFRSWGALVTVGEAPGHVRDTEMALIESGVGEALHDAGLRFADLNYEDVAWRTNRGRRSQLKGIYFPRSVAEADLVVSMPKLKTHHWVGLTCAMKNLYGTLPGIKYGWPKNVLHHNGIPETVVDIQATLPRTIAIVDGIDCMEGDGPILGSLKHMGVVMIGANLAAVDATAARVIGLAPERIDYLRLASPTWGPIKEGRIDALGERWGTVASPFRILDEPHLRRLRQESRGELAT